MRPWDGVPAEQLCQQHLLGVHAELHKCAGSLLRACPSSDNPFPWAVSKRHWRSIAGLVKRGFLDPDAETLKARHKEVADEMSRRGMNHRSPFMKPRPWNGPPGQVDKQRNRQDLRKRCPKCAALMDLEKPASSCQSPVRTPAR